MKLYPEQNPMQLEPHFSRHMLAMTAEGLHDKAAIAEQLAYRDQQIEVLRAAVEPNDTDQRMREGRQLLRRMVKYVRKDQAVAGNTRLERLTATVDDYLQRTHRASDVLRDAEAAEPVAELAK